MRVALLIGALRGGGAERVCVTLANGLARNGHTVELSVLSLRGAVYADSIASTVTLREIGADHARTGILKLGRWLRAQRSLRTDVILVFNHQLAVMLVALRLLTFLSVRIVARNSNQLSAKEAEGGLWHGAVTAFIVRLLYRHVDLIVAQSEGMQRDLSENFRCPKHKIVTINNPNSVTDQSVAIVPTREALTVLYAGRLVELKGLNDLIDAFSIVQSRLPEARLVLAGEGPQRPDLERRVRVLSLEDHVDFVGFDREIWRRYASACVVVLTSRYEGFPNVLVEAISFGTPVIAFDCPSGPSEIIVDGVNGYLIGHRDTDRLAQAVISVLTGEARLDERQIRSTAQRYTTERVVAMYERVLAIGTDSSGFNKPDQS
jgi:glycosyltransferase involved in cell wall biosynthesis